MQCVVAAHRALQFGKLSDHAGDQVGLRQPGGPFGQRRIGAQGAGDFPGEQLHAFGALELGAQLVVVDDFAKERHARFEAGLAVLRVKEPRVFEARTHHALVAADNVLRVGHVHVRHDQEFRQQLAGRVEQREVFLVLPHREDQALLRNLEELGVERADVHGRVLDQGRDFIEQVGIVAEARRKFRRPRNQCRVDLRLAIRERRDHLAVRLESGFVFIGIRQGDVARTHEAVSAGDIARRKAQHHAGHNARTVQHDELVHGPHELRVAVAPAHDLRDRELLECFLDFAGEGRIQGVSGGGHLGDKDLALGAVALFEGFDRDAVLLGEAGDGRRCGGDGRALHFAGDVRGLAEHTGDLDGEPPRRGVKGRDAGVAEEAVLLQVGYQRFAKSLRQARKRFRRQFLGEEFNEQRGIHVRPPSPVSRASESRVLRANRSRPAPPAGTARARGQCRRRARSPKSRRARRAG